MTDEGEKTEEETGSSVDAKDTGEVQKEKPSVKRKKDPENKPVNEASVEGVSIKEAEPKVVEKTFEEMTEEEREEHEEKETLAAMERVGESGTVSMDQISEKDIRDLEKKRDKLNQKAEEYKARRDKLNGKTKSLIRDRDKFNDMIRDNVRKAADCREKRNKLNIEVKEAKNVRETLNKKAAEMAEMVSRMKKERLPKDGINLGRLKKELKELEFKQQTSVLSPDAERDLVDALKKLKAQINSKEQAIEESTDVKDAINTSKEARAEAEDQHQKVGVLAEQAQDQHNHMVELYEKSDELRKDLDIVQEELVKTKEAADEEHRMHIKLIRQVHDYDKIIYGMRRKRRRMRKAKTEASAKKQTKEIMDKFKRGEKLSTEDLMALQTKDM